MAPGPIRVSRFGSRDAGCSDWLVCEKQGEGTERNKQRSASQGERQEIGRAHV